MLLQQSRAAVAENKPNPNLNMDWFEVMRAYPTPPSCCNGAIQSTLLPDKHENRRSLS